MTNEQSILRLRSDVLRAVRAYFFSRDYIEVETPVRIACPALEDHIDAEPSGDLYLRTSPELHLKRLLANGSGRIFEMGPCFRKGELGELHNPEYTMLEWYRTGADYGDALEDTRDLLGQVTMDVLGRTTLLFNGVDVDLAANWVVMTVADAFSRFAGWNPVACFDPERFDLDLVNKVEVELPRDRPVILKDYPAERAALARLKPDSPNVAERWELYVGGIELAGAYSELVDAAEQRLRFEECVRMRRAAGREVYPLDEPFLQSLESGVSPCAGVALGIDRLVMLLAGRRQIAEVRAFCCTHHADIG